MKPSRTALMWGLVCLTPVVLAACALIGPSGLTFPHWVTDTGFTIPRIRVYRVVAGFCIGAGLSCAGVVFQAILRNPLAEPYILGISSGAGLGAAVAILTGLGALGGWALPATAFVFAAVTLVVVYILGSDGGAPSVYGLILSGVIVSAVCSSFLMFLVSIAQVEGLHSIMWWMLGNLEVVSHMLLISSVLLIGVGTAAIWLMSPELNALTLGREMAHHLGVRTVATIVLGLSLATLVTAAAVGLAGLIGFVGLIVPHVMRSLFGPDHRRLVPAAALGGGLFLAVCDAVARTVLAPREIPVGVVTAMLGGPFFLAILRHRRRRGWME